MNRECGWSVGCRGTPVPGRGGRGQIVPALNAMLNALDLMAQAEELQRALKQEPEAPSPWPPRVSPHAVSCPVLGEEVSRETAGPHLLRADGKGSATGVRSGWVRGVQTTEFQCGGIMAQEEVGHRV